MVERAEVQLRHLAWEQMRKLLHQQQEIISAFGGGGEDLFNRLLEMVKGIQRILGVAEHELDVPGGVLDQKFEDGITRWLPRLGKFIEEGAKRPYSKKVAMNILETSSPFINWRPLVTEEDSSGGYKDREEIVRMLVESDDDRHLSVFPIIGKAAAEKTSLVQHIYHNRRVFDHFNIRHWVCMSETHGTHSKLLDQVFRCQTSDEDILREFHSLVDGKRYLLILDGVREAIPGVILHDLLGDVGQGSRIVLAASSTAILGNLAPLPMAKHAPYELGHLSKDEALSLFKKIAFREGEEERNRILHDIGLKVCDKYASVPNLIKNVATILSSKDTVHESDYGPLESILLQIDLGRYKELSSNIQQCVNYCALFPKDYKILKADLVHLWAALGLLIGGTSDEVAGHEYFGELQKDGYFFRDSISDSSGAIVFYKMHDLVNEFIKDIAKDKFRLVNKPTENIEWEDILHLSFIVDSSWRAPSWLPNASKLLSLLFLPSRSCDFTLIQNIGRILSDLKKLQALDLEAVNCENLPDSLGKLQDLKYLRLGCSSESLPGCISNLQNLQTLDLRHSKVRELPDDFCRLINLRHFYTGDRLDDMPPNFGKLKSLQTLDVFIVGQNNGLAALADLSRLFGNLKIRFKKNRPNGALNDAGGVLKHRYLTDLSLIWSSSYGEPTPDGSDFLQPPPTLKNLAVSHWNGERFSKWVMEEFSILQGLVSIHIEDCSRCCHLPAFSMLPHLKSLDLWGLDAIEYIETSSDSNTAPSEAAFFPSLEYLMLAKLPELKGWFHGNHQYLQQPNFRRLSVLRISGCPKVMSIPLAPMLESLEAENIHEKLLEHLLSAHKSPASSSTSLSTSTLKELRITSIHEMDSFSTNQLALESLKIRRCPLLKTLIVEPSTTLQQIEVHECGISVNIIGALKYLSVDWKLGVVKSSTRDI